MTRLHLTVLGQRLVAELSEGHLPRLRELAQRREVELLAPLTGKYPVPEHKVRSHQFKADKFDASGLTPRASTVVRAPRVAECPVQLEVLLEDSRLSTSGSFRIFETRVVATHVRADLAIPGTNHVSVERWHPLFYIFRHYFGKGADLGSNFRAEY